MDAPGREILNGARSGATDDSEPQKFQVSIRVIEAKQLAGIDLDPFVKVIVGKEEKQTKIKKSTSTPTFEEDFFFDFHLPAAVFFDQVIKLQAFSAPRLFRRRKLVGEFQIDVATVYQQSGHYFFEKWAVLVNPKDPLSPPNGYVLCSIVVTRPQEIAQLPHSTRGLSEEDNFEDELLIPDTFAGWPGDRDPAHYVVTVYKAEDLPNTAGRGIAASMKKALQGDAKTGSCVDTSVTVAFAGMQGKTNVIEKVTTPEWNEQIIFCEMFPTFSQSIRLHVRDPHQGVISTSILDFKVISDNDVDEGYPPTFGPSYVHLYGSFRGNTEPSPMNFALAEGVAYRGRLLLSVDVQLLLDEKRRVTLHKVEKKSTKFGPEGFIDTKEKFFLFCCILEACMLDKRLDGRYVHFELSIGKYGTTEYTNDCAMKHTVDRRKSTCKVQVDESESESESDNRPLLPMDDSNSNPYETVVEDGDGCRWRSCTTPALAVADEHYCSIGYGVNKPCMFVTSQWEDYTYRYSHINQLNMILTTLERKLADAQRALEMGLEGEVRRRLRGACDSLVSSFSEYVSFVDSDFQDDLWHTHLDKQKTKQRKRHLERIAQWCREFRLRVMDHTSDPKMQLEEAFTQFQAVKTIAEEPQEIMPDIFLWLVCGNRRVAFRRFKPYELFYNQHRQERGINCGKVQSIFLKVPGSGGKDDENEFSIWGRVTAYLWLGHMSDRANYLSGLPAACKPPGAPNWQPDLDYTTPSYLHYKESHTYELRCHIYQGRSLIASDETGLSDPFMRVILGGQVKQTQIIEQSVNPIWDECLIMPKVELYGSTKFVKANPPTIILQVYDYDEKESYEFIGMGEAVPVVKLCQDPYTLPNFPPKLRWYPLYKNNHLVGEVLAAFELLQLHKDMLDYQPAPAPEQTEAGPIIPIPVSIKPKLSKYQIQVLFWGLRDLQVGGLFKKARPVVEIECAGMVLESDPILEYSKHQNFDTLIKTMDVDLPDEAVYQPPVIIRCIEKKTFGRCVLIGSTTIPSLSVLVHNEEEEDEDGRTEIVPMSPSGTVLDVDNNEEEQHSVEKRSIASYQASLLAASDLDKGDLQHWTEGAKEESVAVGEEDRVISIGSAEGSGPKPMEGVDNEAFETDSCDDQSGLANMSKTVTGSITSSNKKPTAISWNASVPTKETSGTLKPAEEGRQPPRLRPSWKPEIALDWWSKYYASIQAEERRVAQSRTMKQMGKQAVKNLKKTASKVAKKMAAVSADLRNDDRAKQKRLYKKHATRTTIDDPLELSKLVDVAKLTLYRHELENQLEFHHFDDTFEVYPLYHGKKSFADFDDLSRIVGKFKGQLRVFKHPVTEDTASTFTDMTNEKHELIVRVYVVRAHSLKPADANSLADPYLVVSLGEKTITDRSHRIYGQLNPTFGRMFEFNEACLPEAYELVVQVWDWDRISKDDMIGETRIDIEQRFYSKHRATCGLPEKYEETGYNAWRDCLKPSQILLQLCRKHDLPDPCYRRGGVTVGERRFALRQSGTDEKKEKRNGRRDGMDAAVIQNAASAIEKENLALLALRNMQQVHGVGYHLVPEHVETRSLYLPGKPGMAQGALEMWVDVFPKDAVRIPEPVDIKPRKTKSYELRVVVYDTKNVILDDYNILTGLSTVDQYVKGFIAGPDIDGQETDTHYRSLSGEGNFNWRFVFRFDYSDIENKVVYKTKDSAFSLTVREEKIPPELHLQVWDADQITTDDYLGEIVFNLTKIPRGAKSSGSCSPNILKNEQINLFSKSSRKIRAWWPFIRRETDGSEILAGKVDLSFELLAEEEAARKPAGKAHDPPDALPEPVRPETSFAWFTSPLKFLKYTVWLGMRWRLLLCLVIFLLIIFVLVFIYELPRATAGRIVGGRRN